MEGSPAKRKRGRPRKTEKKEPARRGRGRPPKKKEVIPETDSEFGDGEEIEATPKSAKSAPARRGRPPKKKEPILVEETDSELGDDEEIEATPMSPKSVPARRGRGRPRKTTEAEEHEEEEDEEETDEEAGEEEDETEVEAFEAKRTKRRGPRKGKSRRDEVRPSHGRRTRNSARTRIQQRDAQAEADGSDYGDQSDSNEAGGRQQTEDTWQPDGREEKIVVNELREAFSQRVAYALKRNKSKPRITKERIEQWNSPFYSYDTQDSEYWSEENEIDLRKKWKRCPERTALDNLVNYGFTLGTVFKLSFELFNIDPLSLLSWFSDFEFDNTESQSIKHRGSKVPNPLWSHAFCDKLVRIMAHPIFRPRNACRLIPMVIRWATMLRLDDRLGYDASEVHILDHAGCPNLGHEDVEWLEMTKMRDRFKSGQKRLHDAGLFMTPWADLFLAIEKLVVHPVGGDTLGRLKVKTMDLTNVISALDSLSPLAMGVTCEAQFQMWHAGRAGRGYPAGLDEIKGAYEVAWKNAFRIRYVRNMENEESRSGPKNVGSSGWQTTSDQDQRSHPRVIPPSTLSESKGGNLPPLQQSSGDHESDMDDTHPRRRKRSKGKGNEVIADSQLPSKARPHADNGDRQRSQSLGVPLPAATPLGSEQGEFIPPLDSPTISHGVVGGDDGVDGERRDSARSQSERELDNPFDFSGTGNGSQASTTLAHGVSNNEEDQREEDSEGPPSSKKRRGSPQGSPHEMRRMEEAQEPPRLSPGVVTDHDNSRGEEPESSEYPPSTKKRSGSPRSSPSKRRRVTDAQESATSNSNLRLMASNPPPKTADKDDLRGPSTENSSSPGPLDEWKDVVAKAWHAIHTIKPPKEGFGPSIMEDRFDWPKRPVIVDPGNHRLQDPVMGTGGAPEVSASPADISPSQNEPPQNAPKGPRAMTEPRTLEQRGSDSMGSGQRSSRPRRSHQTRPKSRGGARRGHQG